MCPVAGYGPFGRFQFAEARICQASRRQIAAKFAVFLALLVAQLQVRKCVLKFGSNSITYRPINDGESDGVLGGVYGAVCARRRVLSNKLAQE